MRLLRNSVVLFGLGVCVAAGGTMAPGCATGTEAKRAEARGAAGSFRSSLSEMPAQIDATMAKMNTLTDNRTSDKTKALADFRNELAKMDGDARRLAQEADEATKNTDTYFTAWTRDAVRNRNANEREATQESMAERRAHYETARSYLASARRSYVNLTDGLHDIEHMYASGNVDSSQPLVSAAIEKAVQDSVYVKNYIARLGEQIDTTLRLK